MESRIESKMDPATEPSLNSDGLYPAETLLEELINYLSQSLQLSDFKSFRRVSGLFKSSTAQTFKKHLQMFAVKQLSISTRYRAKGWYSQYGNQHVLLLRNDGCVMVFGDADRGQLGLSKPSPDQPLEHQDKFVLNPHLTDVVKVIAAYGCSFFLKSDGTVWHCGNILYRDQSTEPEDQFVYLPEKVDKLENIIDITLAHIDPHSTFRATSLFALSGDGDIYHCGIVAYWGKDQAHSRYAHFKKIGTLPDAKAIFSTDRFIFILTNQGDVYVKGLEDELLSPDEIEHHQHNGFTRIPFLSNISSIYGQNVFITQEGTALLLLADTNTTKRYELIKGLSGVKKILPPASVVFDASTFVMTTEGKIIKMPSIGYSRSIVSDVTSLQKDSLPEVKNVYSFLQPTGINVYNTHVIYQKTNNDLICLGKSYIQQALDDYLNPWREMMGLPTQNESPSPTILPIPSICN